MIFEKEYDILLLVSYIKEVYEVEKVEFVDAKNYKKEIKSLYRAAFPANERAPLFILFHRTRNEGNSFCAVVDRGEFVGLVYTIKSDKMVYVFFLAVDERKRGNGYGTKILDMIKNHYADRAVALMIEDTTVTDTDNYEERINRLDFYKKNGFKQLHIKINEACVDYELLGTIGDITLNDFFEIMKGFFGRILFKFIYRKMK